MVVVVVVVVVVLMCCWSWSWWVVGDVVRAFTSLLVSYMLMCMMV